MGPRIFVADDDETVRQSLGQLLASEGFSVSLLPIDSRLDDYLSHSMPDLAIFGAWLAGMSAIEICRRLRTRPETANLPVVLIVPPGRESERLDGLSAGADDCLVKPFSPAELVIRVKNLLRRINPSVATRKLVVGDLSLDRDAHRVYRQKREVKIGPTEYRLLEFLMQSPGRIHSRAEIRASLWGESAEIDERAIDVHIGRLRRSISLGKSDNLIRTVRGAGYALDS
jgi:two-component system phosphate regulon response regulator PhoB